MTNKLRRSMTSVLLAASLLFSSQSVVAFADYGNEIVISVKPIDDETNPNPPKYDDIRDLIDVKVKCNTQNSGHDEYSSELIKDMYKPEYLYDSLYTIKIDSTQAESYVANAKWDKPHTVDNVEKHAVVEWDGENKR